MSYCLNPACSNPENLANTELCQACGSKLLLRDRYRVVQALGQGGFGATFLSKDESLPGKPYCVIKQLRPAATSLHVLQMARELFHREAQTLGTIGDHPQVPRLLDRFEVNQEFFLVQEYISGSTLQQEVKRSGPFSEAGVKQFLSELLPVLQYVHSRQVIHRDLKPANLIRRSQDKKLVLIDFGAVKNQIDQTRAGASEQTALTQYAIGTPGYAPPEQMAMRPVYASDIYALGVTCLYLLTGKSPKDMDYDPATGEILWREQVHISDHFADVLKKMLEVSVRHRYQSAAEVLRALDLEPYLDSLARGMVSQPTRTAHSNAAVHSTPHSGGADTSPSSPSSPTARMAAAIRAHRARSGSENTRADQTRVDHTKVDITRSEGTRLQSGSPQRRPIAPSSAAANTRSLAGQTSALASVKLSADTLLAAYAKGKRDFTAQDLSTLNLSKLNLSEANFHQSKLHKVNFQGANLSNTTFSGASLNQAMLRNANLSRAYLNNADLAGADLRGADLSYAYLSNANLRGANLCGADLTGAKIADEQLALARTNWATIHPSGKRGLW